MLAPKINPHSAAPPHVDAAKSRRHDAPRIAPVCHATLLMTVNARSPSPTSVSG
jgi:hypothetical protein